MSRLTNVYESVSTNSNDIFILICFTGGLVVILIIIFIAYMIIAKHLLRRDGREKIENYLEKGVLYNQPRDLGNGLVEYDIDACIFVQDDVHQYTNRYDIVLIQSSGEEESEISGSVAELSDFDLE